MKYLIFGFFLFISTFFYSQQPNIDLILDDYRNFFHMMNDNFVDEIDFVEKKKDLKIVLEKLNPILSKLT